MPCSGRTQRTAGRPSASTWARASGPGACRQRPRAPRGSAGRAADEARDVHLALPIVLFLQLDSRRRRATPEIPRAPAAGAPTRGPRRSISTFGWLPPDRAPPASSRRGVAVARKAAVGQTRPGRAPSPTSSLEIWRRPAPASGPESPPRTAPGAARPSAPTPPRTMWPRPRSQASQQALASARTRPI